MKGRILGIYLGTEGVGVAEYDKKKLLATAYMPFAALEEEVASYDQLSSQIKTEALIQRLLRKIKAEAVEAVVALPERDLTFRTLDMPLLKKNELALALPLEVEKYIPFKLQDVFWDHQANNNVREKKTQVAFLSAKREGIDELSSILANVNVHVNRVDAASLSSVAFLSSLGKVPKKLKDFAVIFYGKVDAEICIYENGFPKFSRYTKVPVDFEGNENVAKFIDDIRLTIGYYKREAGQAKIDKVIVVAPDDSHSSFAKIADDLALPAELISLDAIYSDQRLTTMYELKACALAMRAFGKVSDGFNLLQEEKAAAIAEKDVMNYFKAQAPEAPLDPKATIAAMALSGLVFGAVFFSSAGPLKNAELKLLDMQKTMDEAKLKVNDLSKLDKELSAIKKRVKDLTSVATPKKNLSGLLEVVFDGTEEQEGMWLSKVDVTGDEPLFKYGIRIEGYVYVDSPDLERENFGTWVEGIKNNEFVKANGYTLSIESMERAEVYDYSVTKFIVKLVNNG